MYILGERGYVLGEQGDRHLAELEHGKDTAGLEHTVGLFDHFVNVRAVADTKRNRVQVHRLVRDRLADQRGQNRVLARARRGIRALGDLHHLVERLGVAELEADLRRVPVHGLLHTLLALDEHLGVNVEDSDARLAVQVLCPRVVQQAQRNVARAAGHVETVDATTGVQHLHKVVLPQAVDAEGHGIVHNVVRRGH